MWKQETETFQGMEVNVVTFFVFKNPIKLLLKEQDTFLHTVGNYSYKISLETLSIEK